ncbi:50S ribosome-binding GTPase [Ruania alkalisoli]|uniref:50S ribosome-binding GTPase n=1 Tax=Ruania alkalisoli TaxID=2779775 RepID=A0A7M1SZ98_9MICO|nr:GTP-binding protein [Ruania alkalisoli]QOR71963.1 50S ribosome-binding GTPase [Ruania alkalisoli]
MSEVVETARPADGVGTVLGHRVEEISAALDAAGDLIPSEAHDQAQADLRRVMRRLELGVDYTVVALVGGTGSGKSSLFNAVSHLEFADVGVIRPTTARAAACVWGSKATALLDFLQVAPDRRIQRESALDGDSEDDLAGLVLLDLPDHDSVESGHADQVQRLLPLIDLLVWVVDPQKYADNVLHEEYLRALADRHEAMVVVINQIDRLPDAARDRVRSDVQRLLVEDGLADVRIEMVSAREGSGVDQLRALLARVISGESVAARTARDETAAICRRLSVHLGPQDPQPPSAQETAERLALAAGVPSVAESVRTAVSSARAVALAPVQEPASSRIQAIRDRWIAQATEGLPGAWTEAVLEGVASSEEFGAHVWQALSGSALPSGRDRAAATLRLLGLVIGGFAVALVIAAGAVMSTSGVVAASMAGAALAQVFVCIAFLIAARRRRRQTGHERAEDYLQRTTDALRVVVEDDLVEPTAAPLQRHAIVRRGISSPDR